MQQIARRTSRGNEMAVPALLQADKTVRSGLGQASAPSGTSRNTLGPIQIMAQVPINTFCRLVSKGPSVRTIETV